MGEFAVATAPDGTLMLAYRAELYKDHPDEDFAHLRTWNGKSWSDAVIIPFDTGGFNNPIFIRHRHTLLLSWVGGPDDVRFYSVLGVDGTWSFPVPMCPSRDGIGGCGYFAGLHVDHADVFTQHGARDEKPSQ